VSSGELRFLVDVGAGSRVEKWLRENQYNARSVRDIDSKMTDNRILALAVSENRIVITMDKDFGELIYNSGLAHSGVLLLRLEGAGTEGKIRVVEEILTQHGDKLPGKFCVFQRGRLRVR